jgi:hypothetical protein
MRTYKSGTAGNKNRMHLIVFILGQKYQSFAIILNKIGGTESFQSNYQKTSIVVLKYTHIQ